MEILNSFADLACLRDSLAEKEHKAHKDAIYQILAERIERYKTYGFLTLEEMNEYLKSGGNVRRDTWTADEYLCYRPDAEYFSFFQLQYDDFDCPCGITEKRYNTIESFFEGREISFEFGFLEGFFKCS